MSVQGNFKPICCPEINPDEWHDKLFIWADKKFIKDRVCTFLFIPFSFGKVMTRLNNKVEKVNASTPDYLCLSEHTSKWNMNLYLAVDQNIPEADNVTISGKFYARAYEGPFKDSGKWSKDYEAIAKEKGLVIKKMYMWYTTCPKCAKKYGKNPIVIFGQVEE
jgi:hypothetical protein